MKRMLAAMLTALMLVTFLPFASPPAQALTSLSVAADFYSLYVGEEIFWFIDDIQGGSGNYEITFDVYKNGKLFKIGTVLTDDYLYFTPTSPGRYTVKVEVVDLVTLATLSKVSDPVYVFEIPIKITNVESLGTSSLKVTWQKIPGATKYQLWRSTNKNTGWVLAKTTTGLFHANTYLQAGTQYFFKVRYYTPDGEWSKFSPAAAGVPMAKISITWICSPGKGRVRLSWQTSDGASGYNVVMSRRSNRGFRSVRTLSGNSITFSALKSGSILYFKVRPYRKVYSIVNWGVYSPARGVRVR